MISVNVSSLPAHTSTRLLQSRGALKPSVCVPHGGRRTTPCVPRAMFPLADIAPQVATTANEVAGQANQIIPGSVSAPQWVIPVAALVVTIGGAASAYLLKPAMTEVKLVYEGADAAEEVFKKDAKRLGSKAKGKVGQVGQKAKQATRKGKQIVTKKGRK